ncbi:MAG: flavodoxin domain-containing protein [Clostridia bacterium]|nr:flavodoxin domain-containing protein [Clostridia bacterium]
MSKTAVVFYSGSGNTEAMADVVANALGADKIACDDFSAAMAADYDAIAFGCPAMGDEVLEETAFQPMWDDVKGSLTGKKVALFGSYGWGDGQWMRDWEADARANGVTLACESVICNEAPDDEANAALEALAKALG